MSSPIAHFFVIVAILSGAGTLFALTADALIYYASNVPTEAPATFDVSHLQPMKSYRCDCGASQDWTGEVPHEGSVIYRCNVCGAESLRPNHFAD